MGCPRGKGGVPLCISRVRGPVGELSMDNLVSRHSWMDVKLHRNGS